MKFKKAWLTREYLSERTIYISLGSLVLNFFCGIAKVIISLFQFSFYFGLNGIYNIVLGFAKTDAVKKYNLCLKSNDETKKQNIETRACYKLCFYAIATSLIYLCFSIVITFFVKENASYGISMVCFVALIAFSKLIAGIISSVKTKKEVNLIIHYIKLINLADALIGIALTQRVILIMQNVPNANFYSGIGGVVFSSLSLCLTIYMILELKFKNKKSLR